jgi:hypothetical protein
MKSKAVLSETSLMLMSLSVVSLRRSIKEGNIKDFSEVLDSLSEPILEQTLEYNNFELLHLASIMGYDEIKAKLFIPLVKSKDPALVKRVFETANPQHQIAALELEGEDAPLVKAAGAGNLDLIKTMLGVLSNQEKTDFFEKGGGAYSRALEEAADCNNAEMLIWMIEFLPEQQRSSYLIGPLSNMYYNFDMLKIICSYADEATIKEAMNWHRAFGKDSAMYQELNSYFTKDSELRKGVERLWESRKSAKQHAASSSSSSSSSEAYPSSFSFTQREIARAGSSGSVSSSQQQTVSTSLPVQNMSSSSSSSAEWKERVTSQPGNKNQSRSS